MLKISERTKDGFFAAAMVGAIPYALVVIILCALFARHFFDGLLLRWLVLIYMAGMFMGLTILCARVIPKLVKIKDRPRIDTDSSMESNRC